MSETLEPKVIHGKTLEEYKSKFGPDYDAGNLWDIDPKELNDGTLEVDPEKEYWEIDGRYYEAYPETSQNKSVKKENNMADIKLHVGESFTFETVHFNYKDKIPVYFKEIDVKKFERLSPYRRDVQFDFTLDVPLEAAQTFGVNEPFILKGEYNNAPHIVLPSEIVEKYELKGKNRENTEKAATEFLHAVWETVIDLSKDDILSHFVKKYREADRDDILNVFEDFDVPNGYADYYLEQLRLWEPGTDDARYDTKAYCDQYGTVYLKKDDKYIKQNPLDIAEKIYHRKEHHLKYLKEELASEEDIKTAQKEFDDAADFYQNVFELSHAHYLEPGGPELKKNAMELADWFNSNKKEIENASKLSHVDTYPVYKNLNIETAEAIIDALDIEDFSLMADFDRGNFFICDRQEEDVFHKKSFIDVVLKAFDCMEEWDRDETTETENKYYELLDDFTTEEGRRLPVQIDYEIHIPNHTFENLCEKFGNMPEPDASGVFTTPFAVVWASIKDVFKTDSEYFWTETKAGKDETVMNIKALHDVIVDAHTTYDNFKFKELADNALNQPLGISLNNKLNSFDLKDRITFNAEAKKPNYLDLNGLRHETKILDAANTFISTYKDVYKSENKDDFWSAAKHTEEKLNSDTIKLLKEYFAKNNIKTKSDYENFFKVISGSETKTEEKKKSITKEKNISDSFER